MAFVLLNPKLLDKLYAATALEIGLWTLPFTFGTIVGSVAGGYVWYLAPCSQKSSVKSVS